MIKYIKPNNHIKESFSFILDCMNEMNSNQISLHCTINDIQYTFDISKSSEEKDNSFNVKYFDDLIKKGE